ncbi:MAG: aspartate--ammonia ligase [Oscillospiraceae bacterium]|jgi:aspartate--ammonia ligase|nr:aspartate--ammonia ligase [Oscillospiraceae bacterium]
MSKSGVPAGYRDRLGIYETQTAIGDIHRIFEGALARALNLKRVSAPLFVNPKTGLNDDLNGIERPVEFGIKETGTVAQVVQSLAKWKRMALYKYQFSQGEGLYTDMNAIRRDEEMDNLHSIYVDQWDWEKIVPEGRRNLSYLKEEVTAIISAICDTADDIKKSFPATEVELSREISFITTQELEDLYPSFTPKEREHAYVREHHTTFLMQIGWPLRSGSRHDGRAPDYDDWSLNGDILFWHETLGIAMEISSMGIRVNSEILDAQLKKANCDDRRKLAYHSMLLEGALPQTIGGGIGQSRLCMLLLGKAHIGEVQVSLWDDETQKTCKELGVTLL